ncbi:hypothetical protein [Pseudomonas sp. 39167]|nr:hypothetical protein [Pseudomonas sp. 39167]MDD2030095.1 hypothetical protein [Pseudomonas sp. 39167]
MKNLLLVVIKGGSEPARDGVGTSNIFADGYTAIASKPAPTGDLR